MAAMPPHRGGLFSRRHQKMSRTVAWVMVAAMAVIVLGSVLAVLLER